MQPAAAQIGALAQRQAAEERHLRRQRLLPAPQAARPSRRQRHRLRRPFTGVQQFASVPRAAASSGWESPIKRQCFFSGRLPWRTARSATARRSRAAAAAPYLTESSCSATRLGLHRRDLGPVATPADAPFVKLVWRPRRRRMERCSAVRAAPCLAGRVRAAQRAKRAPRPWQRLRAASRCHRCQRCHRGADSPPQWLVRQRHATLGYARDPKTMWTAEPSAPQYRYARPCRHVLIGRFPIASYVLFARTHNRPQGAKRTPGGTARQVPRAFTTYTQHRATTKPRRQRQRQRQRRLHQRAHTRIGQLTLSAAPRRSWRPPGQRRARTRPRLRCLAPAAARAGSPRRAQKQAAAKGQPAARLRTQPRRRLRHRFRPQAASPLPAHTGPPRASRRADAGARACLSWRARRRRDGGVSDAHSAEASAGQHKRWPLLAPRTIRVAQRDGSDARRVRGRLGGVRPARSARRCRL